MIEYLKTYGGTSLTDEPINDVDYLVFAQMAYLDFEMELTEGTPLTEALYHAAWAESDDPSEERFAFQKKDDQNLILLAASAPRYRGIRFLDFVRQMDEQRETSFAALSLLMEDNSLIIAFRGTDNTLAGWKEDFNMAFMPVIPSQQLALEYLQAHAQPYPSISVIGHSKGGNLALYAVASCTQEIQDKIRCAVSFDGPGLGDHIIASPGFERMQDRMRVILPRESLVGLLFRQPENVRVVESRVFSLLQHYPYFWKTDGMDFLYAKELNRTSVLLGESIRGLLMRLTPAEREQFVEAVYSIIRNTEACTLNEMASRAAKSAFSMLAALRDSSPETRRVLIRTLTVFLRAAASALGIPLPQEDA